MVHLVQCTSPDNCANHLQHRKQLDKMNRSQTLIMPSSEKKSKNGLEYPPKLAAKKNRVVQSGDNSANEESKQAHHEYQNKMRTLSTSFVNNPGANLLGSGQ